MLKNVSIAMSKFLWSIDFFCSPYLLRYKNQTKYSTLTGGGLSLIIILVFTAFLIQKSTPVLTMSQVIAKDSTYFLDTPSYTSFKFDSSSNFMIGVGIQGLDLSKPERYFDISLLMILVRNGITVNRINYPLQQCQEEQWSRIYESGINTYKHLKLHQYLCPSKNVTVQLEGKFTSDSFKMLEVRISKCKNSTDPSKPCVSEAIVNSKREYSVNYYFMNPFINSGNLNPIGYYLQDRNYFGFSLDTTMASNLYVTEHIISTDNSLMPWSQIQNKTVLLINQLAQVKNRIKIQDQYMSIYLRKSPYFKLSERRFQKIQDLLSTVGGFIGCVITFFFFMQYYTEACFQVEMGDTLFYYNSDQPLKSKGFNLFFYLGYLIYDFLKKTFKFQLSWKRMKSYHECREQIKEQLDISHLMNKITFLEKCMNIVFEEHQFRAIYLQQKPNVKEAENLRKNHGLNKIIHKNSKKINSKIQEKLNFHKQSLVKKLNNKRSIPGFEKNQLSIGRNKIQQKKQGQIQLRQIASSYVFNDLFKKGSKQQKNNSIINRFKQIQQIQEQKYSQTHNQVSQHIELQQIAGQNHQSLQFVNTALRDIKQIEEESKQGNVFSQRIYNQLNNDITKQQLITLKCIQTILESKPNQQQANNQGKLKLQQKKSSLFQNLMKLTTQTVGLNNTKLQNLNDGLEIILQSNCRISSEDI